MSNFGFSNEGNEGNGPRPTDDELILPALAEPKEPPPYGRIGSIAAMVIGGGALLASWLRPMKRARRFMRRF